MAGQGRSATRSSGRTSARALLAGWDIVKEVLEPAEAEAIKEAAARVLRGESLRSIAMDWNERGVKTVGGGKWQGSMISRVLMSPRIAKLREHRGEVVGKAKWPRIIDRATHDRLVGLLGNPERRPANYGRPRVYPLAGLLRCGSCGGKLITYLQPRQGRGYGCRKDETFVCPGRVRIAAEPLEAYVEGCVIDQWRNPRARKIAQSDDDRLKRIAKISAEMADLQRQKKDAFRNGGSPAAEEGRIQDEAAKGGRSPDVQGSYEGDGRGS